MGIPVSNYVTGVAEIEELEFAEDGMREGNDCNGFSFSQWMVVFN